MFCFHHFYFFCFIFFFCLAFLFLLFLFSFLWSFGGYKSRNEARKKDMNSWDRYLSIGILEWSVRGQKKIKIKKGRHVLSFWCRDFVRSPIFGVFVSRRARKIQFSPSKVVFCVKFHQKWTPDGFYVFELVQNFWIRFSIFVTLFDVAQKY